MLIVTILQFLASVGMVWWMYCLWYAHVSRKHMIVCHPDEHVCLGVTVIS